MKRTLFFAMIWALPAAAQWRHFGSYEARPTGYFGLGFATPTNPVARRLDTGWSLAGGFGVTKRYAGVMLDFTFADFGLNHSVLRQLGAPRGDQKYWALTVDPVVHVNPHGPVDFYLTGGGGLYSQITSLRLQQAYGGPFCDCDDLLGRYTVYKGGVNGGAGFSFDVARPGRVKIFAEARFHHMFTPRSGASFIPVTIGVRF